MSGTTRIGSASLIAAAAFALLWGCGLSRDFNDGTPPKKPRPEGQNQAADAGEAGAAGESGLGGAAGEGGAGNGRGGSTWSSTRPAEEAGAGGEPSSNHGGDSGSGSKPMPCEGVTDPCKPLAIQTEMRACGRCGLGLQPFTRSCGESCTWNDWAEAGACAGDTSQCSPSEAETSTRACGACSKGSEPIKRVCGDNCQWGGWNATGSCDENVECLPDHYTCCGAGNAGWMWCRVSTCEWTNDCDVQGCQASADCDCP